MPTNVLTDMIPKILAFGVAVLRESSVMARLVTNRSENVAAQRGDTINVTVQPKIATRDVVPSVTAPDSPVLTMATVPLKLDKWREAPFTLTDADVAKIQADAIPQAVRAAVQSLGEYVDGEILALYKDIYNTGLGRTFGVPQETAVPAAFEIEATDNPKGLRAYKEARRWMNKEGAGNADRRVVLGVDDESDAGILEQFLAADKRGDQGGIIEGQIGRKLGADWFLDQAVPVHTSGTIADDASEATAGATEPVGETSIALEHAAGSTDTIVAGDVLKFSNHSQVYTVVTGATFDGATPAVASIVISPALKVEVPSTTVVAFLPSHTPNLLFHPDAFAFASRPLSGIGAGNYATAVDLEPDGRGSGIILRLELSRQYKQDQFSFDVLFGVKTIEPRLAARIASAKPV